ncbi:oxidoreductase [Candidatus Pacearchaeota archaeon]|jgi:3-oxoacyl-[acyl-carrier protein] reductase|nr:oxidoreductase [Candidatus Pacearchaeota archaeon]|tara:strand:+ start:1511 stop:2224 length:714 start_codon:yes stop_codon:yes gene_type:complete
MNLKNKNIIVTGASRGIGREICALLGKEGANVIAISRTKANVTKFVEDCGCKANWVKADVTNERLMENVFKFAKRKFKRIDGIINNAGILVSKPISKTTYKEYDTLMKVNTRGVFTGCKLAKKYMRNGVIVNASSDVGLQNHAKPNISAYVASKFAIIGLTESLAKEFKPNIRVYAVCPHSVATGMSKFKGNSPVLIAKTYIKVLKEKAGIKSGGHIIAGTLKDVHKDWKGKVPTVR